MAELEEHLEMLVRRAVREGIADSEAKIREAVREALAEQTHGVEVAPDEIVDTAMAARIVRVQPRTINAWKRSGLLRAVGRGKQDLFKVADVLAVAEDRRPRRTVVDMQTEARAILTRGRSRRGA